MTPQNPAQQALQDQSDAALTDAMLRDVLSKGLAFENVTVGGRVMTSDKLIKDRFHAYMAGGSVKECEHLPFSKGPDASWLAWNPVAFFCAGCVTRDHLRVAGTPEDRRCDICGEVQPEGNCVIQGCTYALQVKPKPGEPLVPPIMLRYGRCIPCYQKDVPA